MFVVENGIYPVGPLRSRVDCDQERVFIGNFNRESEQRYLAEDLLRWLDDCLGLCLVLVGNSGLEGLLPSHRIEIHPPLPYSAYRKILSSCQVALLPLQLGEPQSCKTPIKWLEASVESVAVVGGPELYGPWLEDGRYGLYARSLDELVPLARQLINQPLLRQKIITNAYKRTKDFHLERLLCWRIELYRYLDRISASLDISLQRRFF